MKKKRLDEFETEELEFLIKICLDELESTSRDAEPEKYYDLWGIICKCRNELDFRALTEKENEEFDNFL